MSESNVIDLSGRDAGRDELTALIRRGARALISQALEAEVAELLSRFSPQQDDRGRAAVVRNGYHPEREIQTGVGPVTVKVPKVRSRSGTPVSFRSALVPPYVRKTARLEAALPWLYLKGISTGEMQPALESLLGAEAQGLSASTVSRLKRTWRAEYEAWRCRRLDQDRWVYIWADGIYSGLRAERQRLCALVVVGVNVRGDKHFLTIEDGIRESTQSWREVLLALKSRGLNGAGPGHRRWRHGLLGRARGSLPEHRPAALLDAQDRQHPQCAAQERAAESQSGAARYLAGRDARGRRAGLRSVHRDLRGEVSESNALPGQGPGHPDDIL